MDAYIKSLASTFVTGFVWGLGASLAAVVVFHLTFGLV